MDAVVSELGGSPLALQLANQALRTRQKLGAAAGPGLVELRDELSREGLTAVDPGLSPSSENSILAAMKLATERLSPSDRACLPFLADLPAGQPIEVARVASLTKLTTEEAAAMSQRLATASLVDYDTTIGLLHIHPLTRSFFRSLQQREARAKQTRITQATPAHFTIYLSYRREDSAYVGRITDRLTAEFGSRSIFKLEESIGPGEDFRDVIIQRLAMASVIIVVIGPHWLTANNSSGVRRIDDPNDFVALEIASALKRSALVIPVLVDGASMPAESVLPPALAPLAHRNALEIQNTRFHQDMDALIVAISRAAERRPAGSPQSAEYAPIRAATSSKPLKFRWLVLGSVLIAVGGIGFGIWNLSPRTSAIPPVGSIIPENPEPGLPEFTRAESYFFGRGTPQDYGEAAKWYLQSAQKGYPSAENALGRLYEAGQGVPKDLQEAKLWYEKAAQQGHPDAKAALLRLSRSKSTSSAAPISTPSSAR